MDADTQIGGSAGRFPDTRPSAISAAVSEDPMRRRPGQEAIVAAYWKPVYRYIRIRWRSSNEDAKDLTQAFFAAAIAGWFARRVNSVPLGILVGLTAGLLLAYGVAAMQHGYYFEIMLPGSLVGAIAGYAAQKHQTT